MRREFKNHISQVKNPRCNDFEARIVPRRSFTMSPVAHLLRLQLFEVQARMQDDCIGLLKTSRPK